MGRLRKEKKSMKQMNGHVEVRNNDYNCIGEEKVRRAAKGKDERFRRKEGRRKTDNGS
jgi:hypothetical protein